MTVPDLSSLALSTLIGGQKFAAIDIETTNCGPDVNGRDVYRIISLGVVVGFNLRRVEKKHWLVSPGAGVTVDEQSSAYNKITTADLSKAKPTGEMVKTCGSACLMLR